MREDSISRRGFIGGAMASALATQAARSAEPKGLPTRVLGRTGERVPILALGCGSRLSMYRTQDRGAELIDLAIKSGITYIDTARDYGGGKSERWVGAAIHGRRKGLFIASKTHARTYDDVMRDVEASLRQLGVDQVDLYHLHSLQGSEDLEAAEKNNAMKALYKVREQGLARYIGITSHYDSETLAEALRRYDVDCAQMALNAALQGFKSGSRGVVPNPAFSTSFEHVTLPVAKRKRLGVIAMKVFAQDAIVGPESPPAKLLRYGLSLPVSTAVVGVPKHDYLRENLAWARSFTPMPPVEMKEFSEKLSAKYRVALSREFAKHVDV